MNKAALFQPLTIRGVTFRNRIGVSPMCQYSSIDGFASDWHLVHLGSRAGGGAGIVFTEATAVTSDGRISPGDLGIWKDEHSEMLGRCARFIHERGAVAGIQLAHAGRKASTVEPWKGDHALSPEQGGWRPIWGPSAVAFSDESPVPVAMTVEQIQEVVEAFATAAARAREAGFRVLEIHGAHGYLLNEFMSPLSNQRMDQYGGSFENRTRMMREVVEAIRREWAEDLPLFVRISATDWVEEGWNIEQSVELARVLKTMGVDVIDCSSGGVVKGVKIPTGPGYQTPLAERVRREAGIATAAVGMITEPGQANEIIEKSRADIVLLAREMLRSPYWPLHAAKELGMNGDWPVQYLRAAN